MIVTLNSNRLRSEAILYIYESGADTLVVLEYLTGLTAEEAPLDVSQSYASLATALGSGFIELDSATLGRVLINAARVKHVDAEGLGANITFDNGRELLVTNNATTVSAAIDTAVNLASAVNDLTATVEALVSDVATLSNDVAAKEPLFNHAKRLRLFSDCVTLPTTTSGESFILSTAGTGAGANQGTGTANRPGILAFTTGTTATGRANYGTAGSLLLLGGGAWVYECALNIPTLSDGTQSYVLLAGLVSSNSTANQTNAVYMLYDSQSVSTGLASTTNWNAVTAANSVRTFTNTGVRVDAATWYKLRIEANSAGTSVVFKINGTTVATHTTNIPTATGREVGPAVFILKSAGTTARTFSLDYLLLDGEFTTER